MAYTTIDDPSAHFHTQLYTGDGSSNNAVTNDANSGDFKPDWLWIKSRSYTDLHNVFDSSRGRDKRIFPNLTNAEGDSSPDNFLKSFDTDGFTTGNDAGMNTSSGTLVAWQWKANGGSTTSVSASGTVLAGTYQANTTAGFSIMTYTGEDDTVNTVTHGLGAVPAWIIVKGRSGSGRHWRVYHHKNTSAPETDYLRLNETGATTDDVNYWYDTAPTSSVFSISTANDVNANTETYVAYAWAEVQGYSKFGSYTGNGDADGPFVYTGFKPAWILFKNTSTGDDQWTIVDNKRDTDNPTTHSLFPSGNNAEDDGTGNGYINVDFVSNGFKIRQITHMINASSENYIYMAFAEHPFVSSKGVPVTAR